MRYMQGLLFMCIIQINIFGEIDVNAIIKTNNVTLSKLWFEPYYGNLFNNHEIIKSLQFKAKQKPYTKTEDSALWTLIRMGETEANIAAVDVIEDKIFDSKIEDSEIESIMYYDATDCGMRMLSLLNSTNVINSKRFKNNKKIQEYAKDGVEWLKAGIETQVNVLQALLKEYKKSEYTDMFVWETFRILSDKVSVESFSHVDYVDEAFEPMVFPKMQVGDFLIYYQYFDNHFKNSGIVSVAPTKKEPLPTASTNSLAFGEIPNEPIHQGCVFHLSPSDMKILKDAYEKTDKANK